ncbi:MAG: type I restriction-modification system subunit M N-terminal domain-containing protein [Lactobacillales bacterium]|jgi:type I restriction enzyme M protein|nr:type I restriction-modification system subunit M N-terminal domain-containing protein [Lactobacillales bacterium]
MFEQIFKNIDDTLRKDAGCSSELEDYTEQSSWLLFLKYLDDLDEDRKAESSLTQKLYHPILDVEYRWGHWAAPKNRDGDIDENKAQTGDKLKEFVNSKLFPYLKSFKDKAKSSDTIHYKIGEIFSEIQNKIQNGFILRDILDFMDKLRFRSQKEKFELSVLYHYSERKKYAIIMP